MKKLKALMVEDRQDDTDLLVRALERGGYQVEWERVCTADAMRASLASQAWDAVLSDFSMPDFSALEALQVLQSTGQDLPFIIISGTIGEDTAVGALKAGAHDFLIKGKLARLHPALERELREAAVRAERRQTELALRQSEARFRILIERLPELVLVYRAGAIVYANPAAARAFSCPPEELIGSSVSTLVHPEDLAMVKARIARVESGESAPLVDQRWLSRDRGAITVQVTSQPLLFDGAPSVLAVAADVTEQRKIQAQLLVSDRMATVGTLAAGVAHEINNPLAAVLANLSMVVETIRERGRGQTEGGTVPDLELEEPLREAQEAAGRVREIVQDLKVFSRSDDAERRGPVDVQQTLESSLRLAWNEIRHRARVVRDFQPVPAVLANDGRLGQVFLNLLVNAAQAIPEGKSDRHQIRVVTRCASDGRVIVEVTDTGSGIAPEVLRRLFTPFFTTKPVGEGTGLGLSICHRLVTAIGGELTVESELGVGTTFRILLPPVASSSTSPPTKMPAAPVPKPRLPPGPSPRRLLVVDDELIVAKAIQRSLGRHFEVVIVTAANAALELIGRGEHYDAILCDLMMPQMTGMELHAELQRVAPGQAERMIFLTGGAFTASARDFLATCPNPRLDKPFEVDQLLALVSERLRPEPIREPPPPLVEGTSST